MTFHDPAGLASQLRRLERLIRDLGAGNQLNASSVRDPVTGLELPLSALAFGLTADDADAPVTLSENSATWKAADGEPSVTVEVATGRLIVDLSAALEVSGNKATMLMGALLVSEGDVRSPSDIRALGVTMDDAGQSQRLQGTRRLTYLDLTPGTWTVTARYRLTGAVGQPTGITGTAAGRSVVATPF